MAVMDDALRAIAASRGVFLRAEARTFGYDDQAFTAALRTGRWVRVRRGAYTFRDIWQVQDPAGKHRILSRAVMRSLGSSVALSHTSAVLEHGIAVWGADLTRVHVMGLDGGAGRVEKDVVHQEGVCVEGDLMEKDAMLVTGVARSVIEASSRLPVQAGLVITDWALHHGLVEPDDLGTQFASMQRWPFTQKVHLVLAMADKRSESVGETRSRYLFWSQGLPAPTLQFQVYDDHGNLVGIHRLRLA